MAQKPFESSFFALLQSALSLQAQMTVNIFPLARLIDWARVCFDLQLALLCTELPVKRLRQRFIPGPVLPGGRAAARRWALCRDA